MSNALKSWSFLLFLSLTLIVLGHFTLGREGLLIGLMAALGINFYVYFYEDLRVVESLGGRRLEGQDPWGLATTARSISAQMRVPNPKIVVLPKTSPQALVVGRSLTHGTLIITEGLLQKLDRKEIEAVLAYLIACVKNLNTLAFSVGSFLAWVLLGLASLLDAGLRLIIVEKKRPDQLIPHFFTRLSAPLIGFLLRVSVRPHFYFDADRLAGDVIDDHPRLAQVLWKLNSYSRTEPFDSPLSISHMFVVNPLTAQAWTRYFHAQPTTEKRIRALIGHYPL
jgi:heat shock protein HtpX